VSASAVENITVEISLASTMHMLKGISALHIYYIVTHIHKPEVPAPLLPAL